MGALPLAPDEAFSALQANQPERLPTNGLAAPSHARVVKSTEATVLHIRFVGLDLCQMCQPAGVCRHRSLAVPRAESGAPSAPTV